MQKNYADSEKEFYSFSDLVDVAAFSHMLENFFKATGIPNGLVGADGELISQAGWHDACTQFHRVNPDTKRQCEESNLELMQKLREGEVASNSCKNGLYYYATPIVIDGHQPAYLFLGQVFDSQPDIKFFQQQAKQFGFDKNEYMNTIRAVPVISKDQMEAHVQAIAEMTQILAANGLARLRETRLKLDLDESTEERIQTQDLLDLSPVGIGWSNADRNIEYINHKFTELFGYTIDDLPNLETWYRKAYPDAGYRKETIEPWQQRVAMARQLDVDPPELEAQVTCKDGSERHVLIRASWVGDKRLVNFTDITEHWQSEQRNHAQNAMLEMVARAEPLPHILNALVVAIEAESPSTLCSVHILDEKETHLLTVAAPSLPAFYNDATDKVEIGDGVGSCGTAVFRRARVIVKDISTHEYWRNHSDLAQQAGLAACWSEPIISSDDKVLGTFAIYHRQPAVPNIAEIERIAFAANMAAIAIENHNTREKLLRQGREFRTLAENIPINISRFDRDGHLIYANSRVAADLSMTIDKLFGTQPLEEPSQPYTEIVMSSVMRTLEDGVERSFEIDIPIKSSAFVTHLITMVAERDESGSIVGVLATGQDISERKRLQRELERQARFDFLTGLLNRRYFIELAKMELLRLKRNCGKLSLIMFDIDYFKQINDTHGHNTGDQVLKRVAHICHETVREIDIVGRLGGEEFVVLLPQTDKHQAFSIAERLRLAIVEQELESDDGKEVRFTASFGVVTLNNDEIRHDKAIMIDDILIKVDKAMYQAKENGRNNVYQER